ncbi:hypothetical protein KOW79_021262 [Hemibagrus wyckioides]|uniref:Uncharacterized protein n=1 Tax=Hemibagrus wyckioides TaxID=337641 RepID=A0A9D3N381_9TELE|nr:hypothetical protein KOW79_021262 [Hemibagrus wyckioides]
MRSAFDWMSLAVIRRRGGTDPRRGCARTEHQAAAKNTFLATNRTFFLLLCVADWKGALILLLLFFFITIIFQIRDSILSGRTQCYGGTYTQNVSNVHTVTEGPPSPPPAAACTS